MRCNYLSTNNFTHSSTSRQARKPHFKEGRGWERESWKEQENRDVREKEGIKMFIYISSAVVDASA